MFSFQVFCLGPKTKELWLCNCIYFVYVLLTYFVCLAVHVFDSFEPLGDPFGFILGASACFPGSCFQASEAKPKKTLLQTSRGPIVGELLLNFCRKISGILAMGQKYQVPLKKKNYW